MEAEKSLAFLCNHFKCEYDKDELSKALFEWNTSTAQCYRGDVVSPKCKNSSLLINMFNYKLVCGQYTEGKCIKSLLTSKPEYCVILNPADSYIW